MRLPDALRSRCCVRTHSRLLELCHRAWSSFPLGARSPPAFDSHAICYRVFEFRRLRSFSYSRCSFWLSHNIHHTFGLSLRLTSLVSHLGSFYFTSRTVFSFPLAQVCCDKSLQVSFIRKCLFHFHSRKILSLSIKPEPSGMAVHLLEHVVAVEIVTCESDIAHWKVTCLFILMCLPETCN